MARTTWKRREREAAKMVNGRRYHANVGGPVDVESDGFVCQVKERKTLSLAQQEALAVKIERIGNQKGKCGIVMTKRSAGRGVETPWLITMTEGMFRMFRYLNGRLPTETP